MRTECVTFDIFPGHPHFGPMFLRPEKMEKKDIIPETVLEWKNFILYYSLLLIISENAQEALAAAQTEIIFRFEKREKKSRQAIEGQAFEIMVFLFSEKQAREALYQEEKTTLSKEENLFLLFPAKAASSLVNKKQKEKPANCFCR